MAGSRFLRLGSVCLKIGSGATPRGGKEAYKGGKTSLIRSQNIYNDGFHRDGLAYIDDAQARELSNVEVQPGDVLLNITGDSVARCCQVADDVLPARVNQHVAIIRSKPTELQPRFLRYCLVSQSMQNRLLSLSSAGATRPALTKSMIESLQIPAPPLPEQKAIAHILGTLDDKIELNRRMNQTLEAIAQALFKKWFIDPARNGRPKGWRDGTISNVAKIQAEALDPGRQPARVWEHYSIPAFDEGHSPSLDLGESIKSNKYKVPPAAVLVSKLNPQTPRVWLPAVSDPTAAICSTEFIPFVPTPEAHRPYVFELLRSAPIKEETASRATGTTGSRQRVNPADIARIPCAIPPEQLVQRFCGLAEPLHTKVAANIRESRTIAQLRDTLLPKLLSGEVRVKTTDSSENT